MSVQFNTNFECEFTLMCSKCGNELVGSITTKRNETIIYIEPCENCLSEKDKEIDNLISEIENLKDEINLLETREIFQQYIVNGNKIRL